MTRIYAPAVPEFRGGHGSASGGGRWDRWLAETYRLDLTPAQITRYSCGPSANGDAWTADYFAVS